MAYIGNICNRHVYQRLAMIRCFATHKCPWNFEYEWVNSIEIQLLIRTLYNIDLYVQVAMSLSTTLTSNIWHSKYVWFIRLLILVHKFRKIFIILINDSSDSNHSSKFSVLVIFSFKIRSKKKTKTASIFCLLLSIVVFVRESYTYFVIIVYVDSWRVEINNIMRIVMYEYDEYLKLWIWVVWV